MGHHYLLQGIFLTQGSNRGLLLCGHTLYQLSYLGSLIYSLTTKHDISSEIFVDGLHQIEEIWINKVAVQFSSVDQLCLTLCDPKKHSMPGLPVHHQPPEFTQTQVRRVSDAIQPSSVVPFASSLQSFPTSRSFQMSQLSHQVAKVLEFQL